MKKSEFRASSLEERKKFYEKEFEFDKVNRWFKENKLKPQICAIDAGSDTGIIIDKELKGVMLYFRFSELNKKIKKYIPEDIYYDRNFYENPEKELKELKFKNWKKQELVFDFDADNLPCSCERLCLKCLARTYRETLKMKEVLMKKFGMKKIVIVYSGEGFHLHVLDEKAFLLNKSERKKIANAVREFPIDKWVSEGNISLIRLPYSLNGSVSRKVIPLTSNMSYEKSSIPKFLSKKD